MIERYDSNVVYAIEAEIDNINTANEVILYYTPGGILIRSVLNGAEPDYRPIILGEQITNYISTHYPSATAIDIAAATDITEVDIMDNTTLRKIYFDSKQEWLMTASRIASTDLPEIVIETIAASQYAAWEIVEAEAIENPDGEYYQVTLAGEGEQVVMKVNIEGRILQ
jgi:hypothetical protein